MSSLHVDEATQDSVRPFFDLGWDSRFFRILGWDTQWLFALTTNWFYGESAGADGLELDCHNHWKKKKISFWANSKIQLGGSRSILNCVSHRRFEIRSVSCRIFSLVTISCHLLRFTSSDGFFRNFRKFSLAKTKHPYGVLLQFLEFNHQWRFHVVTT
jgi:hypothetical protein